MLIDNDVLVVVCNYKTADDGDDGANGRALNMFSVRLCQRRSAESIRIGPDGYGDDGLAPASPHIMQLRPRETVMSDGWFMEIEVSNPKKALCCVCTCAMA